MRDLVCDVLPWLALAFALLGMREWDPAFPGSLLIVILLFWAINWLVHHISPRWRMYLRSLSLIVFFGAFIVVPELRPLVDDVAKGLLSLQSSTLIVLSVVTLIIWAVICLARPAQQPNS